MIGSVCEMFLFLAPFVVSARTSKMLKAENSLLFAWSSLLSFWLTVSIFLLGGVTVKNGHCEETATATVAVNLTAEVECSFSGCTCAIFLDGQFVKWSKNPPKGNAAVLLELEDEKFPCNLQGYRDCKDKCAVSIMKYSPNSDSIICGSIGRDCSMERAYVFVKNCNSPWKNTHFSAGRPFCCKNGMPYKCPSS